MMELLPTALQVTRENIPVEKNLSAGSNPYENFFTATQSGCPPKGASLDQLTRVYVLYKLSKTNSVKALWTCYDSQFRIA